MKITALVATGAAIGAFGASGCGGEKAALDAGVRHVGEDAWVQIVDSAPNAHTNLNRVNDCVIMRGAELILRNGEVFYNHNPEPALDYDKPGGTECPNGTKLDLAATTTAEQDTTYKSFIRRKEEVTSQVENMVGHRSTRPVLPPKSLWIELANPTPVASENGIFAYGDECNTDGASTAKIGTLATGETVMRLTNPDAAGTLCPSGSIYLEPSPHKPTYRPDPSFQTQL